MAVPPKKSGHKRPGSEIRATQGRATSSRRGSDYRSTMGMSLGRTVSPSGIVTLVMKRLSDALA